MFEHSQSKQRARKMDNYQELHSRHLGRLEGLVRRLLEHDFGSAQDIWDIEVDLIQFQIELQEAITEEKTTRRRISDEIHAVRTASAPEWKDQVRALQQELRRADNRMRIHNYSYRLSRRFGDTLAWVLLGGKEQRILPLTEAQRTPSVPSGPSLQGMLGIAEAFSSAGAGFPLLHDMTNCLRVGDITFILPDKAPVTIEVKTQLLGQRENVLDMRVAVYGPVEPEWWDKVNANLRESSSAPSSAETGEDTKGHSEHRLNSRLRRQIGRMGRAKALQESQPGVAFETPQGEGLIIHAPSMDTPHNRGVLRDLVLRAKEIGFASIVVDDAFVYVATYNDPPIAYPWSDKADVPHGDRLVAAIASSGIWFSEPSKNALWLASTWSYLTDDVPAHIMPFFLYDITPDLVIEMLCGRLTVHVFVNLGKLVAAVERTGLSARLPKGDAEVASRFVPVWTEVGLPDGSRVQVELHGLAHTAAKIAYEFLSVAGFVDIVTAMVREGVARVQSKWAEQHGVV